MEWWSKNRKKAACLSSFSLCALFFVLHAACVASFPLIFQLYKLLGFSVYKGALSKQCLAERELVARRWASLDALSARSDKNFLGRVGCAPSAALSDFVLSRVFLRIEHALFRAERVASLSESCTLNELFSIHFQIFLT